MITQLYRWMPPDAVKILLTLFLSFLIGLEREEHKADTDRVLFGGVRTFPLIGLVGYAMSLASGQQLIPFGLGFAVVGGFLMLSYRNKLASSPYSGVTSEMSGLVTYLIGALVYRELFWIATTLTIASMLLLELKTGLEGLTKRIPPVEIFTFTKFLLLTAVILPVIPNETLTRLQINPFKTWLIVVAVSAVSYGSYVIQKLTNGQRSLILAAILGGAYSSTVATVVLAKRAASENRPHLISGATLMASGVMYLRLAGLLGMFNRNLFILLSPAFAGFAVISLGVGWLWSRQPDPRAHEGTIAFEPKNPLELSAAFIFGFVFVLILIATHAASVYLGKAGVYALAAVMGISDVDPFIMGMTQSNSVLSVAAAAILIAAASNNFVKGIYAYVWSDRKTGRMSLCLLSAFAILGLTPLLWMAH